MPIYVDVISKLDDKAAKSAADRIEQIYAEAGKRAGASFDKGVTGGLNGGGSAVDMIGKQMQDAMQQHGRKAGQGFGSSFGSELSRSLPGVSGVTGMMAGYEGAASKVGALAGKALGTAFKTAAAGVIGLAAVSLFKGFERYKSLDATAHRLGALGKSGEQVRDIMGQINDVVSGTPIALDAAGAAATKFLQAGVREGKPLKTVLTAIADAAGASGSRFEDMELIFSQVLNKGKLQAEEMLQMAERNLPIQQALQKEFGLTADELAKMSKDGKISFGMLVQAVEGQFGGLSKKLGDTIEGSIQNMQSAIGRVGANFISAIFGDPMSTTEGPGALAEAIQKITAKFEQLNQWVIAHQGDIKDFFEDAARVGGQLFDVLKNIAEILAEHPGLIAAVVGAFAAWKTISGVAALSTALSTIAGQIDILPGKAQSAANKIGNALAGVSMMIGGMGTVLNTEQGTTPNNMGALSTMGGAALTGGQIAGPPGVAAGTLIGGGMVLVPGLIDAFNVPERPQGAPGVPFDPNLIVGGDAPGQSSTNPLDVFAPVQPGAPAPADETVDYNAMFPGGAGGDGESGGGKKEGLPSAPVLPFDASLPPEIAQLFAGRAMTSSAMSAQQSWLEKRHDLAEKEARLQQLLSSNVATEDDIQKARNDKLMAEADLQQQTVKLYEDAQKEFEKANKQLKGSVDSLGELGVALDKDLGISKGLSGIAENITRFVANLAAAPVLGALGAVSQAGGGDKAGSGLAGLIGGALGFGPAFEQDSQQSAGYSRSGGFGFGNPNLNAMMSLAQWSSGKTKYAPASDLINGLADCSGSISDLVEMLQTGRTTPGRLFTTTNFASDEEAAKLGFKPGFKPGALNVGVNPYPGQSGHMAATLPNGVNFEGGGATGGGAQYGGNAAGALDNQFEKQYYLDIPGASQDMYNPGGYAPVAPSTGVPTTPLPTGGGAGGGNLPGIGPIPQAMPNTSGVQIGGNSPSWGTGKGGVGIQQGGLLDSAIQMGMSAGGLAIDAMAPGAGQVAAAAANMGIKLGNRAIQFAGQAAGIGVGGLLETFLPFGSSELAQNNWLTRIVGGVAGAAPQIPNIAGGKGGDQAAQGPQPPNAVEQTRQQSQQGQQGNVYNTTINAAHDDGQGIGRDFQYELANSHALPGNGFGG